MANYVLVPLNPHDDLEEIMPSVEQVAQMGMTVIFLIPYRANRFFTNRLLRAELSAKGISADSKVLRIYSYYKQQRLADQRISVARDSLETCGIGVMAYVYFGRLRPLLKRYRRNGGVQV
jgi:hypothetical protein